MARKVRTIIDVFDDLTGEIIPEGEVDSITFSWDGRDYEIDLNRQNSEQLREFMGRIVAHARKADTQPRRNRPSRAKTAQNGQAALPGTQGAQKSLTGAQRADEAEANGGEPTAYQLEMRRREQLREVREWARENGWPNQGNSGRLQDGIREAWNKAHPDNPCPEPAPSRTWQREQRQQELAVAV